MLPQRLPLCIGLCGGGGSGKPLHPELSQLDLTEFARVCLCRLQRNAKTMINGVVNDKILQGSYCD